MSDTDVEKELARFRGAHEAQASNAVAIDTDAALVFRNAGNLPDELDRSLRLVLFIDGSAPLSLKRLDFEPDYQSPPTWRVDGSRAVNVLPLRMGENMARPARPWWEDPEVAPLEEEWRSSGSVAGIRVPEDYRGFVYKTIIELRATDREISPSSIADSIARWLPHEDVEKIRDALTQEP